MSIINGSRGIIYFVHQFQPRFVEATWFESPDIAAAVGRINAQVQGLAKVILKPASNDVAGITLRDPRKQAMSSDSIAITSRRHGCSLYVFAVSLSNQPLRARIDLSKSPGTLIAIDEERQLEPKGSVLEDDFRPYEVHLYTTTRNSDYCEGGS
jgi:hypothetical protein